MLFSYHRDNFYQFFWTLGLVQFELSYLLQQFLLIKCLDRKILVAQYEIQDDLGFRVVKLIQHGFLVSSENYDLHV